MMNFNIIEGITQLTSMGSSWVLYLLIVLSGVSIAVMINRIIFFKINSIPNFKNFSYNLSNFMYKGDVNKGLELCVAVRGLEGSVARIAIKNWEMGADAIKNATDSVIAVEKHQLDRGLVILGTLGSNAPFIGLLGTVLGIIKAFHDLSLNSSGGAAVVMAGISEALVATAVGLVVAIPAIIAFNYFQRIIKLRMSNAESLQHLLLACFAASTKKGA